MGEIILYRIIVGFLMISTASVAGVLIHYVRKSRRLDKALAAERLLSNHAIYLKIKDEARNLDGKELSSRVTSARERLRISLGQVDRGRSANSVPGGSPD